MNQNRTNEKTCEVCHQPFQSERELQDHNMSVYSGEKLRSQPTSDRRQDQPTQGDEKRERIA